MKKYLLATGIALLAMTAVVSAQGYSWDSDLSIGASGQDVVNLQTWLISNGFDIPAISGGYSGKGYFGEQTRSAVSAYQRSINLPAYGYFGPMTRNWLNGHGGGSDQRGSSLRVTSPNGGENWHRGTVHSITWTGAQGLLNQTAEIRLQPKLTACAEPTAPIRCLLAVRPYTIAQGISLNSGSYSWTVGNAYYPNENGISSMMIPNQTNLVTDGQYKVQICPSNGSQCDESDAYFNITGGTTANTQPVINGVDAPTTLSVNQIGTWTVRASDPANGSLNYSVTWGDEPIYSTTNGVVSSPVAMQTSSFTHSYQRAGTFTVTVTVRNSSGGSAQTSSTVTVSDSNSAGALKIITPNGGEVWKVGTTQTIRWTSPYYIRATYADIWLRPYAVCPAGYTCNPRPSEKLASNISINQNSFNWVVGQNAQYGINTPPATIPAGQYLIGICEVGAGNCDYSDTPFNVSEADNTNLPDINIVSPNGGEIWKAGTYQNISVNITGDPTKIGQNVDFFLTDQSNYAGSGYSLGSYSTGQTTGIKSYQVFIPTNYSGSFKIYSTLSNSAPSYYCPGVTCPAVQPVIQAYDYSDNFFTINSAPVLLQTCPNTKVINQMPSLPNVGVSVLPSTYYVLNNQRRELTEFDQNWVATYCNVPVQYAY